ncbi:hypothetical protein ScPMuIL_016715 [Solemya velum]
MDEQAIFEAEIAQQLELVNLDVEEVIDNSEDENEDQGHAIINEYSPEISEYLKRIQEQTENFERELSECDGLLQHSYKEDSQAVVLYEESQMVRHAAEDMGLDVDEYRKRILAEIEREDELPLDELLHDDALSMIGQTDIDYGMEERAGTVAVIDQSENFQKMLQKQIEEMEIEQKEKAEKFQKEKDMRAQIEEKEAQDEQLRSQERMRKIQHAEEEILQEKMAHQKKLEEELQQKEDEMEILLAEQEKTIQELSEKTREEKKQFEERQRLEEIRQYEIRSKASTRIQSYYRGHRVRTVYGNTLREAKERRRERKQEERIAEIEIEIRKREEEKKIQEQEEKKKAEEVKLEEKRKQQEEMRILREKEESEQLEKAKKEAERKEKERLETERKQMEKQRKEEEQRMKEEEKKRKLELEKLEKEKKEKEKEEKKQQKREQERLEKERKEREKEEKRMKKLEQERLEKEKKEKQKEEKQKQKIEQEQLEKEKKEKQLEEKRQLIEKERLEKEKVRKENEERKLSEEKQGQKLEKHLEQKTEEEKEMENGPREEEVLGMNIKQSSPVDERESGETERTETKIETNVSKHTKQKSELGKHGEESTSAQTEMKDVVQVDTKNKPQRPKTKLLVGDLPVQIEARRLEWIKSCLPWSKISNEPWKLKPASNKVFRRPSSAKKMQPLNENMILTAAQASSLRQVSTVQLEDLPGCSLTTLGQCWGLQCLKATNCGLVAVEGLLPCKQLQYLELKNNRIVYVDLKDMGSLQYVDLSNNALSAIHGLDNCSNIRWLNLSNNKISRLGGVGSLRRLHTLNLVSNQLISTQGIGDVPTLQTLDISHNHVQQLEDMDKLCLLKYLTASSNNITKLPVLKNHVLLQELNLEDNSIDSIKPLSRCWLPLLDKLNLAQNSLDLMESLEHFCMLSELNIGSNQICDDDVIISAIGPCKYMKSIVYEDNPVSDDLSIRLLEMLPRLKFVNNEDLKSVSQTTPVKPTVNFEAMCLSQMQLYTELFIKFEQDLGSKQCLPSPELKTLCDIYFNYCDRTFKIAVEHRYAHEYGDIMLTVPTAPTGPKPDRPLSARTKHLQSIDRFMSPKEMFEKALNSAVEEPKAVGNSVGVPTKVNGVKDNDIITSVPANVVGKMLQNEFGKKKTSLEVYAATKIQAMWKGYQTRKFLNYKPSSVQQFLNFEVTKEICDAVTKIQATWRGYSLRCKFQAALEYAHFEDLDEDDLDLPDIDLQEFVFDENLIDDWKPPDTPQLPQSYSVIGKPPSGRALGARDPPGQMDNGHMPQGQPLKAWRSGESQASDVNSLTRKMVRPTSAATSSITLESYRTGVSKKEEQISEEWGFKDSSTAHLMLQRAKKMKYNSERKKKLSKLDPRQRLALFRRLEETTGKIKSVQPPPHKILPRKEYFQARQQEINMKQREHHQESQTRVTRTYEWLHTQVGNFPEANISPQLLNHKAFYGSEGNIPNLDNEIVGKHIGYMQNMELQSVESASIKGETIAPRRYSAGEDRGTRFPPIKTNSAPSVKEKMSWRNKKVETNVGWGGGRKRSLRK